MRTPTPASKSATANGSRRADAAGTSAVTHPRGASRFNHHLLAIEEVYHVGTLEPDMKRRGSHEGAGLSVSLDPDVWRTIARLGDRPTWVLRRDGGAFLDVHSVRSDHVSFRHAIGWAMSQGYVVRGRLVELHLRNDAGAAVVELFATRDEAERERTALGDTEASITASVRWLMTARMAQRAMALRPDDHALALDHALSFFAEDCLPNVDGLWWTDDLDPGGLSAPRGVICESRLASWAIERQHAD